MARVLCAWEFGTGLGHVRRIVPIARELRAMGHEVIVAFRDSMFLDEARTAGIEAFIAPLLRTPKQMSPSPLSFSDILLNLGFDNVNGTAGALRAWRSLFELLSPDLLVSEYAPTALIAARLSSIPRVTIGAGFSQPILRDPLPALRPWLHADPGVLRALDDRLLQAVRRAWGAAGPVPSRAYELFEADLHLLCTFPEIDPYGPRQGAEYIGPQGDSGQAVDVQWQGSEGTRVFAYLKSRNPRFEPLLAALKSLDAEVVVAAPGLTEEQARNASTPRMRVVAAAVNLDLLLPGASLCIAHAGAGVPARAMAAGVPMALLPMQLDQFLMAKRIEKTGAAEVTSPEAPAPDYREWFTGMIARKPLAQAAAKLAESYRDYSFATASSRAAKRIASVLQG